MNSRRPRRLTHRSGVVLLSAVALVVVGLTSADAQLQPLTPDGGPGAAPAQPAAGSTTGNLGGRVGVARLREDWYLNVTPTLYLEIAGLKLSRRESRIFDSQQIHSLRLFLEVPLLFRVADRPPTDDRGSFRRELWDEPAEYIRVLRWVEIGDPYDGVYLRGGELGNVRIGHRTIVDSYDNVLNTDHFQWGLHTALNTVYGGLETLIDDLTGPEVMALRAYVRPWAFVEDSGPLRRLAAGVTLAGDRAAPTALALNDTDGRYAQTASGDLIVSDRLPTAILGWDLEYQAVQSARVSLTPYTDVNTHMARGTGWHTGVFFGVKLTPRIVLDTRVEYRLMAARYLPAYIGRMYEIERLSHLPVPGSELAAPKLTYAGTRSGGASQGYLAELGFNFANLVQIAAGWEDRTGADNNAAWAQLRVPALSVVQFGAYFVNTRFEGPSGLFELDNALAVAEARVMATKWLYFDAQLRRRWEVDATGDYSPVNDWWLGTGVSFGF